MAVSNQATQEVDAEVDRAAMSGMLNLRDVLELVDDRFNNGAFASQHLVRQPHQARLHVAFGLGIQLDATGVQQLLKQRLRHVAPVSKDFAKHRFEQFGHGLAVVGVTGGQHDVEQFALVIETRCNLKPKNQSTDVLPRAARS